MTIKIFTDSKKGKQEKNSDNKYAVTFSWKNTTSYTCKNIILKVSGAIF